MFRTDGDSEVILAAWQHWGAGLPAPPPRHVRLRDLRPRRPHAVPRARPARGEAAVHGAPVATAAWPSPRSSRPCSRTRCCAARSIRWRSRTTWPGAMSPITARSSRGSRSCPPGITGCCGTTRRPPRRSAGGTCRFAERAARAAADLEAELLHHLREAVTSRMVADVPLGAFLSGGVDSSSVVALMAEASREPVRTCSIGFDVAALDETGYARKVAQRFGTDHRERIVSQRRFRRRSTGSPACSTNRSPMPPRCRPGGSASWRARRSPWRFRATGRTRRSPATAASVFHAARGARCARCCPGGLRAPLFGTLGRV